MLKRGRGSPFTNVSKSDLGYHIQRCADVAGLKQIRVYVLSHFHVSSLVEFGFSVVAIVGRIGHESIEITYRYAHPFSAKQTEMVNLLTPEMEEMRYFS